MKTPKSYRLSPRSLRALEQLKTMLQGWTETEIIEAAIDCLLHSEAKKEERKDV